METAHVKMNLKQWIDGALRASDPQALQWVIPLSEDTEAKMEKIHFTIGVIEFVRKTLCDVLQNNAQGTKVAFELTENESHLDIEKRTQQISDFLQTAGATPDDIAGSMVFSTIAMMRTLALNLQSNLDVLMAKPDFESKMSEEYSFPDVLAFIDQQRFVANELAPTDKKQITFIKKAFGALAKKWKALRGDN